MGGRSLVIGGPSNLLPDTPINLLQSENYPTNISMIAGVTKDEGTFLTASKRFSFVLRSETVSTIQIE